MTHGVSINQHGSDISSGVAAFRTADSAKLGTIDQKRSLPTISYYITMEWSNQQIYDRNRGIIVSSVCNSEIEAIYFKVTDRWNC